MGITAPTSAATSYPLNRKEFGIHAVSAYNRTTGDFYGELAILGDASLSLAASSVDLTGGSSLYAWATEVTGIDASFSCNVRSFTDWVMELWMAGDVSTIAPSASTGTISALTNVIGTSTFNATTGIASIDLRAGEAANMKTNYYRIKPVTATTVDVYAGSDFQFSRGTNLYFDDDTGKITSSPLTVVSGTTVEIPGTGLDITGGSGTIAMVVDDVAEFKVAPPHQGISDIDLGVPGVSYPEHGLLLFGKERGSGEKVTIECYKAQCTSGLTYNMAEGDFAKTDVTVKLLYDEVKKKIGTIRFISAP